MVYLKEQLEQANLYALRNIAREIGVKAPCTLNKQSLIDEIIIIQKGEKLPYFSGKKGRPVKTNIESQYKVDEKAILKLKEQIKKEIINSILKEVERKLNDIL